MVETTLTPHIDAAEVAVEEFGERPDNAKLRVLLAPCTSERVSEITQTETAHMSVSFPIIDGICALIRRTEHAASAYNRRNKPEVAQAVVIIQPLLPLIEDLHEKIVDLSPYGRLNEVDKAVWLLGKAFLVSKCVWARRIFRSFFASCGY